MASQQDAMTIAQNAQDWLGHSARWLGGYGDPQSIASKIQYAIGDFSQTIQPGASQNQIDQAIQRFQSFMASPDIANNVTQSLNTLGSRGGVSVGPQANPLLQQFQNLSGVAPNQYLTAPGGVTPPPIGQPPSTTAPGGSPPPTPQPGQGGSGLTNPSVPETPGTPGSTPVSTPTVPGTDISQFIPPTSQQQQDIINQAITQSQGLAGQNFSQLQNLIGPYIQQQFSQYTDPKSPAYQATIGELNNSGLADSGAFPQALASRLAPLISQGVTTLGEGTLIPSFMNQQNLISQGADVQSNLGLDPLQRFIEEQNWKQQSDLANQLAAQGESAQFGSGIGGLLGGGLGAAVGAGFGGLPGAFIGSQIGAKGGQGAGAGLSWICTHLKEMRLATEEEVNAVHDKLFPTYFHHPLVWMRYFTFAPLLILFIQDGWDEIKVHLIDDVLEAESSEEGFRIYCEEVKRLCLKWVPALWHEEEIQWS